MRPALCVLIAITVTTSASAQQAWQVDRRPAVSIPATAPNGDLQFSSATWATRTPSGTIAIADATDGTVRIADSTGRVVRSLGRRGGGPGEFAALVWVGACGDSLYTWDMRAARVSVFHDASGFARQFVPAGTASSLTAACSRSGGFAAFTMPGPGTPSAADERGETDAGGEYEVRRMMASVLVTDATGAETARISGVLWGEMIAGRMGPGGGFGALPRPLGGQTSFAFVEQRLVIGRSDSARIDIHEKNGARVGGFTLDVERSAPTAEQYERAIPGAVSVAPQQMHERLAAFARSVPRPERAPAFSRLLTDPEGLIWLVESLEGAPVTRLRAYRANGTAVARLELPVALSVFEVGSDHVLGRTETADGDEAVVLYRFARAP